MIYDTTIHDLKTKSIYFRKNVSWFFSSKDQLYSLSNMASGMPIDFRGIRYNSSEQLYQCCKYHSDTVFLSGDKNQTELNIRDHILKANNAMGAKIAQKCAVSAGLVRPDWYPPKEVRIYAMLWVLELKAIQNIEFRNALISTENNDIVEISRHDNFWGCKHVLAGQLIGNNILGKLLMLVRDNLSNILVNGPNNSAGYLL